MWEHKSKSLIIGILVALGVVIIVLGNAMMDAAASGIRTQFIESFTGNVMIHGPSENAVSIFGIESMSMDAESVVPVIPDYEKILARVKEDPRTANVTSMSVAYGLVTMDADESIEDMSGDNANSMIFGVIFGVDAASYFDMFPSVHIIEGAALKNGEAGVMLTNKQMERLEKKYKRDFVIGDKVLITGVGSVGMRIREAAIVGVYERKGEEASPAPFIFTDVDTARVLGGLTLGTDEAVQLDASQTSLLGSTNADDLFSGDVFGDDMIDNVAVATNTVFDSAASLLGDTTARDAANTAKVGAWNFILVRTKSDGDDQGLIASMTKYFADEGIEARAVDWKGAAGTAGNMVDIIRTIFNVAILIIAVVAVIIMMNTLVVSVIERTAEIGTMRALGAQRSFVRWMFLTETLTITVFFGLVGSVVALAATAVINVLKIPASNALLEMLFGGKFLYLTPRLDSFVVTIVMVFIVGYLAHLYPVSVALKVQPVQAMQTE
jgi:putative ABC transport system permease protein